MQWTERRQENEEGVDVTVIAENQGKAGAKKTLTLKVKRRALTGQKCLATDICIGRI